MVLPLQELLSGYNGPDGMRGSFPPLQNLIFIVLFAVLEIVIRPEFMLLYLSHCTKTQPALHFAFELNTFPVQSLK